MLCSNRWQGSYPRLLSKDLGNKWKRFTDERWDQFKKSIRLITVSCTEAHELMLNLLVHSEMGNKIKLLIIKITREQPFTEVKETSIYAAFPYQVYSYIIKRAGGKLLFTEIIPDNR